jgi:hypothetical protein
MTVPAMPQRTGKSACVTVAIVLAHRKFILGN